MPSCSNNISSIKHFYRPQRSCESYVFTPVCLSTEEGEVTGKEPPLGPGTPPGKVHLPMAGPGTPPGPGILPHAGTPPGRYTLPPDQVNSPWDQVHHPHWDQVHPRQVHIQDQVHPLGRCTPRTRYILPGRYTPTVTRYTPHRPVTPPWDQIHPLAYLVILKYVAYLKACRNCSSELSRKAARCPPGSLLHSFSASWKLSSLTYTRKHLRLRNTYPSGQYACVSADKGKCRKVKSK